MYISNLYAFNEFIPATELSGGFPKFSTYYHKQYSNFSEGFSDIGVMLSYPELLKNFSFGADFKRFGDDKFNNLESNLFIGYKSSSFFTPAISFGFINRGFGKDLVFSQDETLPHYSTTKPIIGVSGNINFQHRFKLGIGAYYLNQPNISLFNSEEQLPMKIILNTDIVISRLISLGAFMIREDERNYYGFRLGMNIPLTGFNISMEGSTEKRISSYTRLNTSNYWDIRLGYDYNLESNLNGTNYFLFVSKELIGSMKSPDIKFLNPLWNQDFVEVSDKEIDLTFEVENQDRLKYVKVFLNDNTIFEKKNIREYEKKYFTIDQDLKLGDNELFIEVAGVNGKVTDKKINIYCKSLDIEVYPIADEIYLGEEIDVVWESTIDDGQYGIYLFENGIEKRKLNKDIITEWESEEGMCKKYRFTWKVNEIKNGKDYIYRIRVKEFQKGLSSESNEFTGDITEPEIVIWDKEIKDYILELTGKVEDRSHLDFLCINGLDIEKLKKTSSNKWEFSYDGKLSIGDNLFVIEAKDIYDNKTQQNISQKRGYEYLSIDDNVPVAKKMVPNRIGIVIGIEDYNNIEPAKYANRDAKAVYNYFTKRLGIEKNNIYYFSEDTKTNPRTIPIRGLFKEKLGSKVERLKNTYSDIQIVFYYSGHGLPDEEDKSNFYLLPEDYDPDYKETRISFNQDILSPMKKYIEDDDLLVIVLDACFSGKKRGSDELLAYGAKPAALYITIQQAFNNMVVFSSSSGLQKSYSYDRAEHGLFTYTFLRALKEFDKISLKELANYIKTSTETISSIDEEKIMEIQQPDVIPPELLERVKITYLGKIIF